MNRLTFFLAPLPKIKGNIAREMEKIIYKYCDLVEILSDKANIKIPSDYYGYEFFDNLPLINCLYGENNECSRDLMEYLRSIIMECGSVEEEFNQIVEQINKNNNKELIALLGLEGQEFIIPEELYVFSKEKIVFAYRYYLLKSDNLEAFVNFLNVCFPNLIFHSRICDTIKKFNDITIHKIELCRHLSVLNDHGKDLFLENKDNIQGFYHTLKSKYNILSSGKGSNEGLDKHICEFENESVRCNPHTKLYDAYSDYRIYFHFGIDRIRDGNILIGHIGGHWE